MPGKLATELGPVTSMVPFRSDTEIELMSPAAPSISVWSSEARHPNAASTSSPMPAVEGRSAAVILRFSASLFEPTSDAARSSAAAVEGSPPRAPQDTRTVRSTGAADPPTGGTIVSVPHVGGLHHHYERRAA